MDPLFAAFWLVLLAQRLAELRASKRNARRLRDAGAVEVGARHWPAIVAIHGFWFAGMALEVALLEVRPGPLAAFWAVLFALAEGLRQWSRATLGRRWTTRILVVPGSPLVARGPYRWLRHPIYLAVSVLLAAGPMIFGAWRTAAVVTVLNALALRHRIRVEERALAAASAAAETISGTGSPRLDRPETRP